MIGIDEVGRGCWAGPLLVVAARKYGKLPSGLDDSKKLSKPQRQALFLTLKSVCRFGEGWVEPNEIDNFGLAGAMRVGVARALAVLRATSEEEIILDGPTNYAPPTYTRVNCVIDADATFELVSAASIYAKVVRDQFMGRLARSNPAYGFENHVGYGTEAHRLVLERLGPVKGVHRFSYAPVKRLSGVAR